MSCTMEVKELEAVRVADDWYQETFLKAVEYMDKRYLRKKAAFIPLAAVLALLMSVAALGAWIF